MFTLGGGREGRGAWTEDHGTAWIGHKRWVLYAFLRGPIGLFRVEYVLEFFFVKLGVMT